MSKSHIRLWAVGRRIQYGLGFFAVWGMVGALVYFQNFYEPPNCFDGVMNGNETGVDCGGSCVRICSAEVLPPRIMWAKSFKVTDGQYNAVAYIENQNQTAGTERLRYTFQLLQNDEVIAERTNTTALPPNSFYPIFEGRIFVDQHEKVTDTRIILEPAEVWVPASVERNQFRSLDINLINADSKPRLNVKIENTELTPAENVEIVATVFNEAGTPVTASQTFLERIDARSTKDIIFTWPSSIAKTVRSCVIPTDVAVTIDLSGSMNNDGGTPPQPVTDALQAAGTFVQALSEDDQVAVITFATEAAVANGLTGSQEGVANLIRSLEIDPAEETGFTNTASALELAHNELNSERHNQNARRVIVLLTDGLPTATGDEDVITATQVAANLIVEDDIEIYAIGLGEGVDYEFIQSIASDATNAYIAPTGSDLEAIYAEITSSLCESGPTKIDVIAKTKINFAPLR